MKIAFSQNFNFRILSPEQLLSIQKFSRDCQQYLENGAAITRTIPPLKPWALIQLEDTMRKMRSELRIIDAVVLAAVGDSSSTISLLGGAAGKPVATLVVAGALKGAIIGTPLCGIDVGIVAGIGAIVVILTSLASHSDKLESNEVKILLQNLANLVENVKRMNGLMREAYGMSSDRTNKGEEWSKTNKISEVDYLID